MNMYLSLKEALEANSLEHKLATQIKAALAKDEDAEMSDEIETVSTEQTNHYTERLVQESI